MRSTRSRWTGAHHTVACDRHCSVIRLLFARTTHELGYTTRSRTSFIGARLIVHLRQSIALVAATVSSVAFAQVPVRNPPPRVPQVIRDICPEEGCQYGKWIACAPLAVHRAADSKSPVIFTLTRGTHFDALTGNLRVLRAGLVVFRDTVRITDDEILGPDTLVFTPADSLYPLFYGSEGSGTWYLHGKDSMGPWFFPDAHNFWARRRGVVLIRSPIVKWWVRVHHAANQEGWFDATNAPIAGSSPHYEDSPPRCMSRR